MTAVDLRGEVRSLGKWSLGWGVINLIFSGLSSPFGLVLIVSGLASLYFGTPSMLVVHGVIFAWAAISNLFVGGVLASAFTVILVISAVQSFRQFRQYRSLQKSPQADSTQGQQESAQSADLRVAKMLPVSAFLIALASLSGFVGVLIATIGWLAITGDIEPPAFLPFLSVLCLEFASLALALGLASLLSGYRYKVLSILGVLGGATGLLILLYLVA